MEAKSEIVIIRANTPSFGGVTLSWLFSRNQLELILQDITIFQSSPLVTTAEYQDTLLLVVNLEQHFGLPEEKETRLPKYLIMRAVSDDNKLVRVIIKTPHALKIQPLEGLFAAPKHLSFPKNQSDILGAFAMSEGTLAIFPNIAHISHNIFPAVDSQTRGTGRPGNIPRDKS
jgi:hypothetical protein